MIRPNNVTSSTKLYPLSLAEAKANAERMTHLAAYRRAHLDRIMDKMYSPEGMDAIRAMHEDAIEKLDDLEEAPLLDDPTDEELEDMFRACGM